MITGWGGVSLLYIDPQTKITILSTSTIFLDLSVASFALRVVQWYGSVFYIIKSNLFVVVVAVVVVSVPPHFEIP
jgi:hypothetical protein